jgi:hypothetical protein
LKDVLQIRDVSLLESLPKADQQIRNGEGRMNDADYELTSRTERSCWDASFTPEFLSAMSKRTVGSRLVKGVTQIFAT